jgi:hypothetical protein
LYRGGWGTRTLSDSRSNNLGRLVFQSGGNIVGAIVGTRQGRALSPPPRRHTRRPFGGIFGGPMGVRLAPPSPCPTTPPGTPPRAGLVGALQKVREAAWGRRTRRSWGRPGVGRVAERQSTAQRGASASISCAGIAGPVATVGALRQAHCLHCAWPAMLALRRPVGEAARPLDLKT